MRVGHALVAKEPRLLSSTRSLITCGGSGSHFGPLGDGLYLKGVKGVVESCPLAASGGDCSALEKLFCQLVGTGGAHFHLASFSVDVDIKNVFSALNEAFRLEKAGGEVVESIVAGQKSDYLAPVEKDRHRQLGYDRSLDLMEAAFPIVVYFAERKAVFRLCHFNSALIPKKINNVLANPYLPYYYLHINNREG
jgi:hypothetical protein